MKNSFKISGFEVKITLFKTGKQADRKSVHWIHSLDAGIVNIRSVKKPALSEVLRSSL